MVYCGALLTWHLTLLHLGCIALRWDSQDSIPAQVATDLAWHAGHQPLQMSLRQLHQIPCMSAAADGRRNSFALSALSSYLPAWPRSNDTAHPCHQYCFITILGAAVF